jgi:phosphatase NudJ
MPNRWKPNVTVAAIVERDGRYLLVEEKTSQGLMLNNPAGHLDPGESLLQACVRETLEETAHAFTPTALVGIYMARSRDARHGLDRTWLRVAFTGELGAQLPGRALDTGIVRTLWMTRDEIRASAHRHRSPLLLRCVDDHASGRRLPLDTIHTDPSLFVSS